MKLFADDVPAIVNNSGVWVVLGTLVGTVSGYFFKWLGDRDKLSYDKKLTQQEDEIRNQTARLDEMVRNHSKCEEMHKRCEETTDRLQREISELRARDDKDRQELESKIKEVKRLSDHDI